MQPAKRSVTRLGLALTAALLGLATPAAVATADPSAPPSSEPAQPPSSEVPPPSEPEAPGDAPGAALDDLRVTVTFDKPSYATDEKITATVTVTNTGTEALTTAGSFPRRPDRVALDENPFTTLTLDAGASLTRVVTGVVGDPDVTTATLYVRFGGVADHREFSFPVPITREAETSRPLNSMLAVTLAFTEDGYGAEEAPVVRVTLTNKGDRRLDRIVAACEHDGSAPDLTGTGEGWGALADDGVTIPAGTTKVIAVSEPMPAAARDFGYVRVDCAFKQSDVDYGANPWGRAEAAVAGQLAEFAGGITNNDPGAARAGFRVLLFAKGGACPVIAEGTSDAAGRFSLGMLPVGQYEMYVVPPSAHWFFKYGNHVPVDVIANRDNDDYRVWVYEADHDNLDLAQPPECAGGGPAGPPAPQGSAAPGLAHTGTDLVAPGVGGVAALLLGAGALLLTRRRRAC